MKRFFAIILALAAVCSVCACERLVPSRQGTAVTDTSESSRTDEPAQAPQTDEITEAASSEAETEEEDTPELPIRVGEVYKNTKQGYFSDPYIPSLTLDADGGFTLIENLAEGMGTYEGRYSVVGGELVLRDPTERVMKILHLAGLDKTFKIEKSERKDGVDRR